MEILEARIAPASLLFAKQLANDSFGRPLVATDAGGNIFVVGQTSQSVDVDLGAGRVDLATPDAAGDVYVAKYDPDGLLLWGRTWGGTGGEFPRSLDVDASGDLFVAGTFNSVNAGFDGLGGALSATGGDDVFVFKMSGATGAAVTAFDGDGQMKWGGSANDRNNSMVLDGIGQLVVGGAFNSANAGFNGPGALTALGTADGFLFRVDATTGAADAAFAGSGMTAVGGPGNESVRVVRVDSGSNVIAGVADVTNGQLQLRKFAAGNGAVDLGFGGAGTGIVTLPTANLGNNLFDIAVDPNDRVVVGTRVTDINGEAVQIERYFSAAGSVDAAFGVLKDIFEPGSITVLTDSQSNIYVGGVGSFDSSLRNYVYRIGSDSSIDPNLSPFYGRPHDPAFSQFESGMALDANDNIILRGSYATGADLDPTEGVLKIAPRADVVASENMLEGFLVKIDSYGIDAKNPLFYADAAGQIIKVAMSGPGRATYGLEGGAFGFANLDTLELIGTDLATKLTITHSDPPSVDTIVNRIFTAGANQHMGSITLGPSVLLGDAIQDALVDLRVTGKLNALTIDGINAFAYIKLGEGLPYDVPGEDKTPDTYNNHPDLTVGFVLAPGVVIEVIGDGVTEGGVGGGGLGKVTFGGWGFPGTVRTTQSVGNFTVKTGDFFGSLEIDKARVGIGTVAKVGDMTIPGGVWGESITDIEGELKSLTTEAFLAAASITAANIGKIKTTAGAFDGTLILTDPDAPGVPTFTVAGNFTGNVTSASSLKKLNIKGDFTGSLSAPSIGSITAYAFLGTPGTTNITATLGSLGLITSTAGVIKDYEIVTDLAFSGFKVNLGKLTDDTVGIDNVKITAASIGHISVTLAAAPKSTGVDLIGIRDSEFVTTGTGTTKGTIGKIGNVTVTLKGAVAGTSATGIVNSTFDARVVAEEFGTGRPASTINGLGKVTVQISGSGGNSIGLQNATFEGDTIGAIKVSTARKTGADTGHAIETANFTATSAIGALSFDGDASEAQVQRLNVWSGGTVGAVTVKSKTAPNGTLADSAILAGQSLDMTGAADPAKLAAATLGAVTATGSITNTQLVAGASIGAVTVGLDLTDSLLLAGAKFGGDFALDGDETYQGTAAIAAITVKGSFARTSIVAGINPGNGIFGDMDDVAAINLAGTSSIGAISLSAGSLTGVTGSQVFAIEAGTIKILKLGATIVPSITAPQLLDLGNAGVDADDLIVRLI